MKREKVSPKSFIRAWELSETVQEAAKKLGLSPQQVYFRSRDYLKRGVNLKKMPFRSFDKDELNAFIERLRAEHAAGKAAAQQAVSEAVSLVVETTTVSS